QYPRALVAVGSQDRGGRDVVAARQYFQRIAGADDNGAAVIWHVRRSYGARRHAGGGLKLWLGRRRIGGEAAPAAGHARAGGGIGFGCHDRGWQRRGRIGRLRAGILRQVAPFDGGGRHRAGGFSLRRKGILREPARHVGTAAGKTKRDQRQRRDMRYAARAKQLDNTGHGYSLVRNKL